jgi:type I restriction enzyme S subunit
MMEIYRFKRLERWDEFTIPHLHFPAHVPSERIGCLLTPREERVDRSKWKFQELQPITIHFGGEISKRIVKRGREYSLPLLWVRPGDVVLSKIDLKNGAVGILPNEWENVVVTTHFKVYRPDLKRLHPQYLRRLLQTTEFKRWLWANRSGADGRTEVKLPVFEDLEIPLPLLEKQNTFVDDYEAALDRAAGLEREAGEIAAKAAESFETALGLSPPAPLPERPIFIAAFKDIDRWTHEGILRSTIHVTDSAPKFTLVELGSLGKVSYGLQKSPANRPSSHPRPYLRVANVQRWQLDLSEIKEINVLEEDMPKYLLEDGDILLCEGNSAELVGRGAIWHNEIPDCVHQNHVLRARVDKSRVIPEFVLAVINSSYGQAYFR